MRGYETSLREYEDWDEYEDDGDEQEEEGKSNDGYEEVHQPTQEELDYLAIRQRLKDSIRKQMKKDTGNASSGSRDKTNGLRKDNYGSFFGPSQPVIAQRVIQESKSLLENPDLAARICKTSHKEKKSSVSSPVSSKPRPKHPPTVTNGIRKKVEMLKNTRDYSFLLSDDAEVPASSKGPPPRNVLAPKSDTRSAELMPRSKPSVNGRGREDSNFHDGRKPMLPSSQNKPKVGLDKLAHTGKSSTESKKQFGSNNGSGPGRPPGPKPVPSKSSVPATGRATQPGARNIISGTRKPTPSVQSVARKPIPSNLQSSNNRPASSHGQPSVMRRPIQKDQQISKPKVISKHAMPSSKVQFKRSPPRQPPPRVPLRDERPKPKPKRPLRDDNSDDANAIDMIRKMFGYNPNKFRDDDDDDSNMEANFDDIMKEEKISARVAKREDEEQLRLIEEEERRERMRAKKRKMGR